MKILFLIIGLAFNHLKTTTPSIVVVRQLYDQAVDEEKTCKKLIELLKPYNEKNDPLLAGYRACATMVMAKHVFSPVSKLSWFKEGKNLLEKAIAKNSSNMELRFLRFAVQTNLPWFLNYNGEISSDKAFILKGFQQIADAGLKQKIVSYIRTSSELSAAEKKYVIAHAN